MKQLLYYKFQIYEFIIQNNIQEVFSYIIIATQMFLCTPCSNWSTERSFSTFKIIKIYLRSSITKDNLKIEEELLKILIIMK